MKRKYETTIVIPPLTDDEISETIEEVKETMQKFDGEIEKVTEWGKKKLAYEVNNYEYGYYVVILLKIEGKNIVKLKNFYKQHEKIIRNIVIKKDEEK